MAKIHKIAINEEDYLDAESLATYVESLKLYLQNDPSLNEQLVKMINGLPTPRKIHKDFSNEECKILFETVGYIWKKITGQELFQESQIQKSPDRLLGNYWLLNNGILLNGINHFSIIKQNTNLFCTLLNLNGFALQCYLSSPPEKLINYIIKNGGIRILIRKDHKGYFQMSEEIYAKWGKHKVKKFDLTNKIVKILDPTKEYKGWNSGISIKL